MLRDRLRGIDVAPVGCCSVWPTTDFEFDWRPRGWPLLSASWAGDALPVAVPAQAGRRRPLRPLSDVIDRFGAYNVALIDRQSLRVFAVRMGEIQAQTEALGEALKRHRQGGWSAQIYQRRQDNLAMYNLKQAAEALEAFTEQTGVHRLVLGGSPDVLVQFREVLPRHLQEQIVGEFVADISASTHKALQLSLDVAQQADLAQEQALVRCHHRREQRRPGRDRLADTVYALHQATRGCCWSATRSTDRRRCAATAASASRRPQRRLASVRYAATMPGGVDDVANLAVRKASKPALVNIVRNKPNSTRPAGWPPYCVTDDNLLLEQA